MQAKPSDLYFDAVAKHQLTSDPKQVEALEALDNLALALSKPQFLGGFFSAKSVPKGAYLYGPVGRGKTYLMDIFYKTVTCSKKRQHFYEFMNEIHAELRMVQGQADPLRKVARLRAKQAKLFCLDEFFVEDVADAMILSALLHYLFEAGVVIVTTSNIPPKQLYAEGLQRDRFLAAIHLIEQNMQIIPLSGGHDYRLEKKWCDERYHPALHDQAGYLQFHFEQFNQHQPLLNPLFEVNSRKIEAHMRGESVLWIDFLELCVKPRVAQDYLELSKTYSVILLGNVPILNAGDESATRRLIALVDTLYDQKVLLIMAADGPLEALYQGERLQFEFERTKSRIFEMSSWSV